MIIFLTGKDSFPPGIISFPAGIALLPMGIDIFHRELYNFLWNWIIAGGSYSFAVAKT